MGVGILAYGDGALLTLQFDGLREAVETDIAGSHKFFRRRDMASLHLRGTADRA